MFDSINLAYALKMFVHHDCPLTIMFIAASFGKDNHFNR